MNGNGRCPRGYKPCSCGRVCAKKAACCLRCFRARQEMLRGGINPCVHCGVREGTQARGLCRNCWSKSEVRGAYPRLPRSGGTPFHRTGRARKTKAKKPTRYLPGTAGRIEDLRKRLEAGEALWQEGDARPDLS